MASTSRCTGPNPIAATEVPRAPNIFPNDFRAGIDGILASTINESIRPFSGVTSASRPVLMISDMVMSTLFCRVCRRIFHPPVVTCLNGHVCCSECVNVPCRTCKICQEPIICNRNMVIEKQLKVVPVKCTIPECGKLVTASQIYLHYGDCEFRPIVCKYWLLAGKECAQVVPFNEYRSHLAFIHNCGVPGIRMHFGASLDGFFVCEFQAAKRNIDDIFHGHQNGPLARAGLWVAVVAEFGEVFVVNSYIRAGKFYFWVNGLMNEAEAQQYSALLRYFDRDQQEGRRCVDLPRHRVHSIQSRNATSARMLMPFDLVRNTPPNFLRVRCNPDICVWNISVKIEKDEPEIVVLDPPEPAQVEASDRNGHAHGFNDVNVEEMNAEVPEEPPNPNPPNPNPNPEPEIVDAEDDDEGRLIIDEQ